VRSLDPTAPARLVRLDPRSGRVTGRAIELHSTLGQQMLGAYGDVWIPNPSRGTVVRIHPAEVAPPAHRVSDPNPRRLVTGPSRPGRRAARLGAVSATLDPGGTSWIVTVVAGIVDLRRFDSPAVGVAMTEPTEVFGSGGSAHRPRDADDLMSTLLRLKELRHVGPLRRSVVGGVRVTSETFAVGRSAKRLNGCTSPCVALAGRGSATDLLESPAEVRVSALEVRGRVVVLFEDTPDGRSLPETEAVVRTLRFP
jgi:hypothetical protein